MLAATVNYSGSQALSDLTQIAPIVAVTVALLLAIVLDLVLPLKARGAASALVASLGLLAALALTAAFWLRWLPGGGKSAYSGFATGDGFALFFEALFAVLGVFTIAVARSSKPICLVKSMPRTCCGESSTRSQNFSTVLGILYKAFDNSSMSSRSSAVTNVVYTASLISRVISLSFFLE